MHNKHKCTIYIFITIFPITHNITHELSIKTWRNLACIVAFTYFVFRTIRISYYLFSVKKVLLSLFPVISYWNDDIHIR